MMCSTCGKTLRSKNSPKATRGWCSEPCLKEWEQAHPEEARRWIRVQDLTTLQRAELDALLGKGARC